MHLLRITLNTLNIFALLYFLLFLVVFLQYVYQNGFASNVDPSVGKQVRTFDWRIEYTPITRLCKTKNVMTINGQFPGPTQYVHEGDTVVVKVTNLVDVDVSIHWHGVRQLLSCWYDGPAYITQCPIKPNQSFVYKFTIIDQRGTLLWHGHSSWHRATLYGAFIILPKPDISYAYMHQGVKELEPILLGEWWIADVEKVIKQALLNGGNHNRSDAITINGQPGAFYPCSRQDLHLYEVEHGETYLLRLINGAVNLQLYFGIRNHTLTIVEADGAYTEPYEVKVVVIAPGQTLNLLVHANLDVSPSSTTFVMAASAFSENAGFPPTPATAILKYIDKSSHAMSPPLINFPSSIVELPPFPAYNDARFVYGFYKYGLYSQATLKPSFYYMDIPTPVEESFLFTLGYGTQPCPPRMTCLGPGGKKMATYINNVSFVNPPISILEAYYYHTRGIFASDFPDIPPHIYNFTGVPIRNIETMLGTRVHVLPFNHTVQIIFQNTATLFRENHPIHLHGQNVWVVGMGLGNFNPRTDPPRFNLVNPISRNTIVVPTQGWVAIRFRTLNPGVWFLHCHLDIHASWGMSMAFIVLNGRNPSEILPPPPQDLPKCNKW